MREKGAHNFTLVLSFKSVGITWLSKQHSSSLIMFCYQIRDRSLWICNWLSTIDFLFDWARNTRQQLQDCFYEFLHSLILIQIFLTVSLGLFNSVSDKSMDTFYMLYGYSISFEQLVVPGNYLTRYMLCLFNNICFSILTATVYTNWIFYVK